MLSLSLPVALSLMASAGDVRAVSLDEPADISGQWLFHVGDDASFADPSLDDSTWDHVDVPRGLGEQGYQALVGVYWLRVHLLVPPVDRELSVRLGGVDSACQVFVDGHIVGAMGRVDPPEVDAHDEPMIWPIPFDGTHHGEIMLAIRAWRNPLRADSMPSRGGITAGPLLLGKTDDIVRAQIWRDFDKVICGFVVLVVALYHLQLFRRRREQRHYFWFALFSASMGTYLLSSTDVCNTILPTAPHLKIFWASLMLTFPTFVQFLWPLLGRPIRWWWRANQALMLAFAALTVAWPTQWFVNKFLVWFEIVLLLPVMAATTVLVATSAWRGNREARTLLLGTLALMAAAVDNILLERTTLPLPQLASYAMAAFVFSIAISLANRFSRVFRELDEKNIALTRMDRLSAEVRMLNAHVQAKVQRSSEDLSKALTLHTQQQGPVGALAVGSNLDGRYRIDRALGAGGMGAVYAGRDLVTGAAVAIKVIHATSLPDLDSLHRFLREARAVVAIDHPAIVRMLRVDISGDGRFYQVQELVHGITLEERLQTGGIVEPALAARTCSVLADALAAAHAAGVIHRDVKPSNIMLTAAAPGVTLLDFGVAKLTSGAAVPSDHTGTGRHIGTPAYMAPEQRFISAHVDVDGDVDGSVTERIDVYALGVVLHRMIAGGLPGRVLDMDVTAPKQLLDVIGECLREDARARPTASALAKLLRDIADVLGAPASLAWGDAAGAKPDKDDGLTDVLRELVRTP